MYETNKITPPPLTKSKISYLIPRVKKIIPEILNKKAKEIISGLDDKTQEAIDEVLMSDF